MAQIINQTPIRQDTKLDNGDYIGDDGLVYCGKCHTRKQKLMRNPFTGEEQALFVLCECGVAARRAEEDRRKQEADIRALDQLRSASLMSRRASGSTFEHYSVTKRNERVYRVCKRYADGFDEMLAKNQGLLLYGGVGTGKTYAAACIANELIGRRIPVIMTSFIELTQRMQRATWDHSDDMLTARLNRAKLLIIDDLGAERDTPTAVEAVYSVIDGRYRAALPMIITTNLSLAQMQQTGEIRSQRIYDRILETCYPLEVAGESWREGEAARRYDDMQALLEGDCT